MSKASMARAIAKAGKKQEAQTRGLTGNRNAQGDFIAERPDLRTDGPSIPPGKHIDETLKSVEPDVQKYIEDVKAQIDDIDYMINQEERNLNAGQVEDGIPPDYSDLNALEAEKMELLTDLVDKLEENGIPVPKEVRELQLEPYQRTEQYKDDIMRKAYEEEQAYQADLDAKYAADPDPTGGWAEWNSM